MPVEIEMEERDSQTGKGLRASGNVSSIQTRSRSSSLFANHWHSLFELVCPPECVWCETPMAAPGRFCGACRNIFISDYSKCQRCAAPLPAVVRQEDCTRCRETKWRFARAIALGTYRGKRREAVILIKKRSYEGLRIALGELLAERLKEEIPEQDIPTLVVPVPNHWTRVFGRKADTAASIAYAVARSLAIPVASNAITRTRRTNKQGTLSWSDRRKNVAKAFKISNLNRIVNQRILLIDDVLTSGSTVNEIARSLVSAGAASVAVGVVARGTGSRGAGGTA